MLSFDFSEKKRQLIDTVRISRARRSSAGARTVDVAVGLLLTLMTTSAAAGVQIRSDVGCPSGSDVGARLRPMLGQDASSSATLSITRDANTLTLTLSDAAGSVIDARTWPENADCAATAEAFAVVVAAWLGDLPQVTNTVAAPRRASVAPQAAATPRRPGLLTVVVGVGPSSPISRVAPSGVVWPTPALALDVLWRPSASSRGFVGLAFFANLPRQNGSLGTPYDWYRLSAGPEAGLKATIDPFSVMASGGVSAGALVAQGLGNGVTPWTSVFFDVGAFADVRAGLPLGSGGARWNLWLSVHGRALLRSSLLDYYNDPRIPDNRYEAALLRVAAFAEPIDRRRADPSPRGSHSLVHIHHVLLRCRPPVAQTTRIWAVLPNLNRPQPTSSENLEVRAILVQVGATLDALRGRR